MESHQGVLYCLLTPTRQLPAPSAGRAEAERAGGPGGTWPRGDGPGAPSRSRSCPTSTHTNKREAGQSPRGGAGLPGAACRFLPLRFEPTPTAPAYGKLRCPGARLSVFHLCLHGPLSSLARPFLSQTADPQASAASWSRKPPARARVPGRVAPASSHSPRHPGRLFAEVKLVDSRDLGEARALGVSKPFL